MMTIQQLNSNVTDLQELLKSGEYVGYRNGSYVAELNFLTSSVTGSGSFTFADFRGFFILTGAASTSSLLIVSIIYVYKKDRSIKNMKDDSKLLEDKC
ncbi:hypothetical protein PR202_gb22566 [Eleusine coracana subsp. coracana]|uniref:Uncharacterized protein n=1 Tax=Eleusine coracana subsp. coracana TaxID=191504 RepID=A0AAV5FG22_ELECO|nr:hypothetical protein PR202_gb22566 [Eleusine coracana subsp. coracana]